MKCCLTPEITTPCKNDVIYTNARHTEMELAINVLFGANALL